MKAIRATAVLMILPLAGCGLELPLGERPLAEDKMDYIGLWKGHEVSVLITRSGRMEYESNGGTMKMSVSGPIKAFTDDTVSVGNLFLARDFRIDRPPEETGGIWSMVIDGEKVYRTDMLGRLPQATTVPPLEEIRALVARDLALLSQGIADNDFRAFIDNASPVFQSQFDNEALREQFGSLVEQGLVIDTFIAGDFVLAEEPWISPHGVLEIVGRYALETGELNFEASYVYAHPEWKAFGMSVRVSGISAAHAPGGDAASAVDKDDRGDGGGPSGHPVIAGQLLHPLQRTDA